MSPEKDTYSLTIDADSSGLEQELQSATRAGRQFASTLTRAFEGIAFKGQGLSATLRSLTLSLSRMALTAAFKPLEGALGSAFSGLFSGLAPRLADAGGFTQALPIPFAKGGVIASPVTFPLGGGRMGLAGERGPEAILPLARGPDGRLGVASQGRNGIAITFNVTATDAQSFQRTETQIAAMLARTLGRGQRNL